jgi:hypothetical protein
MEDKRKASSMLQYRKTRSELWKERFNMIKKVGYEVYHEMSPTHKNVLIRETRNGVLKKEKKAKMTLRKSLNTTVTHASAAEMMTS